MVLTKGPVKVAKNSPITVSKDFGASSWAKATQGAIRLMSMANHAERLQDIISRTFPIAGPVKAGVTEPGLWATGRSCKPDGLGIHQKKNSQQTPSGPWGIASGTAAG